MAKRGPYAKSRARQDEILRQALRVIDEEGYAGASVSRIAEAAGISKTGLLHHFESKENLLTEVLRKRDELDDPGLDDADVPLAELERAYVDIVRRNASIPGMVELFTRLSIEATDAQHPAHAFFTERNRAVESHIAEAITANAPAGAALPASAETLALIVLAATDGLQLRWLLDRSIDMAGALEALFGLFDAVLSSTPPADLDAAEG